MTNHMLVVGASGVIGAGAIEHFCRRGWTVTALSRRPPVVPDDCRFDAVATDLADARACRDTIAALRPVTHMIYAAVKETTGLVSGWSDTGLMAENGRMFANILDPVAASGHLQHLSLLQGAKAYGAHRHPVTTPAKEDRPRDDHPNFYWLHEDHAGLRAAEAGFALTIFRPQILLGSAPGAAMNPVAAIGAYAALCREMGLPFAYPGSAPTLWELVDTGLLAEAFAWAIEEPRAHGQTYNITNGDGFVLKHAWPELAASLGLIAGGQAPRSLPAFFAQPDAIAAWDRLKRRHGLRSPDLPALLGESHNYLDLLLGTRIADKTVPVLLSTIKIRQAGFAPCRDSLASLVRWLRQMAALRLLPPFDGAPMHPRYGIENSPAS
jgi:nucleoside-diphosphate-sugar epimerase